MTKTLLTDDIHKWSILLAESQAAQSVGNVLTYLANSSIFSYRETTQITKIAQNHSHRPETTPNE